MRRTPSDWIEMAHPVTDDIWRFDVDFLLSSYSCIFGQCPGAWDANPVPEHSGCCAHGAWLHEEETTDYFQQYVDRLQPQFTENIKEIRKVWFVKHGKGNDTVRTRMVNNACIFFNQGKTPNTPIGCALHAEALRQGEDWRDWKPEICWQLPLVVNNNDDGVTVLTAWDRDDNGGWGKQGDGAEGYWCVDDPNAYNKTRLPVYITMSNEIARLIGKEFYDALKIQLDERLRQRMATGSHAPTIPVSVRLTNKEEQK